jgi:hypothetical protein
VTPDSGLVAGQEVTVAGADFVPGEPIDVRQCNMNAYPGDLCTTLASGTPDANGSFTLLVRIQQVVNGADCLVATSPCVILVPSRDSIPAFRLHQLDFAGYLAPQPDMLLQPRCSGCALRYDDFYAFGQFGNHAIAPGGTWSFATRVQNDALGEDDITVTADPPLAPFSVRYFVGYYDVTNEINGAGFTFENVAPGEIRRLAVQFRADPGAAERATTTVVVSATSGLNPLAVDALRLTVRVPAST